MLQRFILATLLSACLMVFSTLSACGFKDELYIPQPDSAQNSQSAKAEPAILASQSQH